MTDLYDVCGRSFHYFRDACRFALQRARNEGYEVTVRRQPDGKELVTFHPDPVPWVRSTVHH